MTLRALVLVLALAALPIVALANHHAWAPYFDRARPFSVRGTIVGVDWVNPAVFVHVRVEDGATGQATAWAFEGESANAMRNRGLSEEMFKVGSPLTVVGWMGRPGADLSETVNDPDLAARVRAARAASIAQFEFPDGRTFPVVSNVPQIPAQ